MNSCGCGCSRQWRTSCSVAHPRSWRGAARCPSGGSNLRSQKRGCCNACHYGVEVNTVNDGLGVESLHLSIGVKLVEIRDTQSKVGVGEEFDGLSLLLANE